MTIDSITFLQWAGTACLVPCVGKELEDAMHTGPGLIFIDKAFIVINVEKGQFWTIAGRDEFEDDELFPVMQWLWDNHSRDNYDN